MSNNVAVKERRGGMRTYGKRGLRLRKGFFKPLEHPLIISYLLYRYVYEKSVMTSLGFLLRVFQG